MADQSCNLSMENFNTLTEEDILLKIPKIIGIMESYKGNLKPAESLQYFEQPGLAWFPLQPNLVHIDEAAANLSQRYLNVIETFLMDRKHHFEKDDTKTRVFTTRNVLTFIMRTPYNAHSPYPTNSWTIRATRFNGHLYLAKDQIDKTLESKETPKLQRYCISDTPVSRRYVEIPKTEHKRQYGIYESHLGVFDLIYSGLLSGTMERIIPPIENLDEVNKCRFVSVNTMSNKLRSSPWTRNAKVLNWWLQSYLSNQKDMYVAFKDAYGHVHQNLKHVEVQELPTNQNWQPNVCCAFLHKFLQEVDEKMATVDCAHTVYEFKYDSSSNRLSYSVHLGKSALTFLNEEFIADYQHN